MLEKLAVAVGALTLSLVIGCGGGTRIQQGPMPENGSFTGVWHSPQYGEMHMVQTGSSVVGEFTKDERSGRIQGTVQGNMMRFEWSEERELVSGVPNTTRGRGYFLYDLNTDGDHVIEGEWGHDASDTGGGPWTAVRDRRASPSLSGDRTSTSGGEDFEEFDTPGGGSADDGDL